MHKKRMTHHERLVHHVQTLERMEAQRQAAAEAIRDQLRAAKWDGFDPGTLRVVLRLRRMTLQQRRERRALEAIYLAELGMLDGEGLPEEARRRLDPPKEPQKKDPADPPPFDQPDLLERSGDVAGDPPSPPQQQLQLKDPGEARAEGEAAAEAGKRIYDNPYPAGDPCRAAWDEGWCSKRQSHGMELPDAYRRRSSKPPDEDASGKQEPDKDASDDPSGDAKKGGE